MVKSIDMAIGVGICICIGIGLHVGICIGIGLVNSNFVITAIGVLCSFKIGFSLFFQWNAINNQ